MTSPWGQFGHFWKKLVRGAGVMGAVLGEEVSSLQSTPLPHTHTHTHTHTQTPHTHTHPHTPTTHAPACPRRRRIPRGQKQTRREERPKKVRNGRRRGGERRPGVHGAPAGGRGPGRAHCQWKTWRKGAAQHTESGTPEVGGNRTLLQAEIHQLKRNQAPHKTTNCGTVLSCLG